MSHPSEYSTRLRTTLKAIGDIFLLLREHKKWWLLPIFFVFGSLALLIVLLGGNSVLPVIYILF